MPTYQYECSFCEHKFEINQGIKAKKLTRCPECRTHNLRRLIGPGGSIIFKGTGFYETDYKQKESGDEA